MKTLDDSVSENGFKQFLSAIDNGFTKFVAAYILAHMVLFSAVRHDRPENKETETRDRAVLTQSYKPVNTTYASDRETSRTLSYRVAQR